MPIRFLLSSLLAAVCVSANAQSADAGAKLAQQRNCMACHAIDKKMVGPAFRDVAKKYAGKKDAENLLVTKVMKGGSGVWGAIPMPPQAVSDAEAHTMVGWILRQK